MMDTPDNKVETAESAKKAAKMFTFGNLIAVTFPPFFVIWFGASILVYAIYRHHPNPRVGYFTQRAAYYYYGLAGSLIPIILFASGDLIRTYWLALWATCAVIMIILSALLLKQISNEPWKDIEYKG